MGALEQAMKRYGREWSSDKSITPDRMKIWFGSKLATRRPMSAMRFTNKAAVVFIGVSCIGKTTFMKRMLKDFPGFKMINYDDCYNEAREELNRDDNATELHTINVVDRKLEAFKDNNIIIDGCFLHPATRASLFEVLNKVYGYEVHVVYFSMGYVQKNFLECANHRAVQCFLYEEYMSSLTEKQKKMLNQAERDKLRETIIETIAAKRKVTMQALYAKSVGMVDVKRRVEDYYKAVMLEIQSNNLYVQYARGYFLYGADFFYEI